MKSLSWREPFISNSYTDKIQSEAGNNGHSFAFGLIVGAIVISLFFFVYLFVRKQNVKKRRDEKLENNSKIENSVEEKLSEVDKVIAEDDKKKAQVKAKEAELMVNSELPEIIENKVKDKIQCIDVEYTSRIIPEQKIIHVNYSASLDIISKDRYYYDLLFPKFNTVVFPYRRSKVELRGYTEFDFENKLRSAFEDFTNYKVLGDVSILPRDGCHPYEPDIAIIEVNNRYGIRIDIEIEIDEPYSGYDKQPIHYIGCGDEYRDKNLINLGWIVIRFSETQIYKEASKCISLLKYIISQIDPSVQQCMFSAPTFDKHWTFVEAQIMEVKRYRENLMNHEFGKLESSQITKCDIIQNEVERAASTQVGPLVFETKEYNNIDKSCTTFSQDCLLSFESNEHIICLQWIIGIDTC